MKIKFLSLLVAVFALVILPSFSFADLSSTDQYELDNATPGTRKINNGAGLGHMLAGIRMTGVSGTTDALGNCNAVSPSTTMSGNKIFVWQVPTSLSSCTLGNGITGQDIIIVKGNTGSTVGKITPTTKTGFTDISLTNQGDGVTLEWHDSTGWLPKATFGSATSGKINP